MGYWRYNEDNGRIERLPEDYDELAAQNTAKTIKTPLSIAEKQELDIADRLRNWSEENKL